MTRMANQLKRLTEMSPAEVAFRVRDKLRSEAERLQFCSRRSENAERRLWSFFDNSSIRRTLSGLSFKRYLHEYPAERFYLPAAPEDRKRLQQVVIHHFPKWKQSAVEEAEQLCQHYVKLLGYGRIDIGRNIDWHRDPISGKSWPCRFWTDYDLVHETTAGDPKVVHEVNRQQHLPRLAKAYFLTGEERYAREAVAQINSWIDQNPPAHGINWHSSLEIALRVISWIWTIFFLLPSESFDEDSARRVGCSLLDQLEHIYRHLSVYSSPNTHLIGEATALFLGGLIFSESRRAPAWRRVGASLLEHEMRKQVSADGIHAELSSYYHCYATDFYLQALLIADRNRSSFPNSVGRRLESMLGFLMHLTRPDGTIPLLGDDDGGRALSLTQTNYRSFRDALCTGAVLFQCLELKHQAGEFSQETLWLLGEPGWSRYVALGSSPPKKLRVFYPVGGYSIQRSGWNAQASHLVFDCGGMGMIRGGHGHADSLSLVLSAGGEDLLVDPGTCLYNGSPEWRNFFRSTRAHNTALVDGRNQSDPDGTFRWSRVSQSSVRKHLDLGDIEFIEGEHDGYSSLLQGVIHRRRLLHCRPDYWVVVDDFRGEGDHTFDLCYHFGPSANIRFEGSVGIESGCELCVQTPRAGLRLWLRASAPMTAELVCGQSSPLQGWISSLYGERKPAPMLRVNLRSRVPLAIVSVLAPFATPPDQPTPGPPLESYAVTGLSGGTGPIACKVKHGAQEDVVIYSMQDSIQRIDEWAVQGELFWLCKEHGVMRRLFARNARSVECSGQSLLCNGASLETVWKQFDDRVGEVEPVGGNEPGEIDYVRDLRDCALRSG